MEERKSLWEVFLNAKVARETRKLPSSVTERLARLIKDLECGGPVQKNWSHFSALKKNHKIPENSYHCHIKSGRPTYVVCWYVEDKKIKIIEIFYVGTHEKAPY